MKHIKSERLKKLESELKDLEQWLKLGLVPKKDIEKHKEEIESVKQKLSEEQERLAFLKESGDVEEYSTPKKQMTRTGYTEMPSIPDVDITGTAAGNAAGGETTFGMQTEHTESDKTQAEDNDDDTEEATQTDEHEDSYFGRRNRWHGSGILDPDRDEW